MRHSGNRFPFLIYTYIYIYILKSVFGEITAVKYSKEEGSFPGSSDGHMECRLSEKALNVFPPQLALKA